MSWQIIEGDCREQLRTLPAQSVQTCVTSPPYFGLRDYGTGAWDGGDPECDHVAPPKSGSISTSTLGPTGQQGGAWHETTFAATTQQFTGLCGKCGASRVDRQIGLEPTPDELVAALVDVFREVRRVLRDDGTVWLNLGDSYATRWGSVRDEGRGGLGTNGRKRANTYNRTDGGSDSAGGYGRIGDAGGPTGRGVGGPNGSAELHQGPGRGAALKEKDLIGIPWMVAFALRADGWYLRSDIIWAKPNPMPESVTDRPTKSHEYLFLLSKGPRYFYDADAIREADAGTDHVRAVLDGQPSLEPSNGVTGPHTGLRTLEGRNGSGRNKRSVWTVATQPYGGAHFATFPPKLIEPCVLAGSSPKACGECGAPWRRAVERSGSDWDARKAAGEVMRHGLDGAAANGAGGFSGQERTFVGWESSCDHDDDTGSSVVLDPFAGSGTTGLVALRHGRSFVGIELNPEYVQLARNRICDDAPLLNTPLEVAA